jgi:hypothetical protein
VVLDGVTLHVEDGNLSAIVLAVVIVIVIVIIIIILVIVIVVSTPVIVSIGTVTAIGVVLLVFRVGMVCASSVVAVIAIAAMVVAIVSVAGRRISPFAESRLVATVPPSRGALCHRYHRVGRGISTRWGIVHAAGIHA